MWAVIRELDPGEEYELTVTARAPWPPWPKPGGVVVATGVPEQPEYMLRFRLDGAARLRAEPEWLLPEDLRSPGGARVHLVWSDDWPPGQVIRAEASCPALVVEVLQGPEGQDLIVRAPEGFLFPKHILCVTLWTNDEIMPELRVCARCSRFSE